MEEDFSFNCCFGPPQNRLKCLGEDSQDSTGELTPVQKAFHIQTILEEVFENLDYEDLKSCRLVSPNWRRVASKEMLGREKRVKFLYYMGESKKVNSYYLMFFIQNPRIRLRLLGL